MSSLAWWITGSSSKENTFDAPTVGRRYIILDRFIEWLESINPLDTAEDEIAQDRGPDALQQAPITINLEAPRASGTGPKSRTANEDATLEALALSRSAQNAPNTNWRSSGANERRASAGRINANDVRRRFADRGTGGFQR